MTRDDTPTVNDSTSASRNRRLKILDLEEIEALYGLPRFTDEERAQYFALAPAEKKVLDELGSIQSQIAFMLQLGYFKARRLFFVFNPQEVTDDIQYIQTHYFPEFQASESTISKGTRLKQQHLILSLCRYKSCDDGDRRYLQEKAREAATVSGKPIYVFRQVLHALEARRLMVPGYTFLQDTVGEALHFEQNRLADHLRHQLSPPHTKALNDLLDDRSGFYEITQLKHEPRDFSATEIKREIERGQQIRALYLLSQSVLPALTISNESIKYYASLVAYYSVFRLRRFNPWIAHIYLMCFIHHRYQRHVDNLLASFIYYVRKFGDVAKSVAKERVYEHRVEANQNLQKAVQVLKLFTDDQIAEDTPFHALQARAFRILEREQLEQVTDHLTSHVDFNETGLQWDHIDGLGMQFKRYLRPILSAVDCKGAPAQTRLMAGIDFLKVAFAQGRPLGQYPVEKIPAGFIPHKTARYLYANEKTGSRPLIPDRYEFYVYQTLRARLEAGDIYCRDSVRFRSFEDDLIDDTTWKRKDALLERIGLSLLQQPIEDHLTALESELEDRIALVNQRIAAGENEYFKSNKKGGKTSWSLKYPSGKDEANHPVFETLQPVSIGRVLDFVHQKCRFMDAFEHVLGRYVKSPAEEPALTAGLLAWGTNMGLGRMGQISDIEYHTLATTSDNFIRLETLREANDRVTNVIAQMPIFHQYDIGDQVHSSSDGQKYETGLPTINARHSPKYFGLKKGIVAYTLLANHIPVNARIIGSNEHESHYVFDILYNNTSQVQPDIHSTDTHGANEVNFAILHLFGYQFAPRYKDLADKVSTSLYGFKHPSQYSEGIIKPIRKINPVHIIEEWDQVQRIMVSLALKTTTQSIITGKLSAYARKNKTRRALWEYDHIIRSLYLLRYIDEAPLRRHVQQALNRGESYHKLRQAVAFANFGKLRFKTEQEQQIWGECSRLITNAIICYNATILSNLLTHRENTGDIEGAIRLKSISPVAWQHINLFGRYEFTQRTEPIDMEEIIRELGQVPIRDEQLV